MTTFNPDSLAEMIAKSVVADIKEFLYVQKPWGREVIISLPGTALICKYIEVNEGHRTSLQYHREKIETICVFEFGTGAGIELNGKIAPLDRPCLLLPGMVHRAIGPCKFLEISSDHLDDVVRLEDDFGREDPQ